MVKQVEASIEKLERDIYTYIDSIKDLVSEELWQNILLDCSKNELFILWLLYRNKEVNMTQIAQYIKAPLNTATGIISRMEKRDLVLRERSIEDKRIVTIRLGASGNTYMQGILKEAMYYGTRMLELFSKEELALLIRMMDTFLVMMKEEHVKKETHSTKKIKKISIE